jgi:hypothetical protein
MDDPQPKRVYRPRKWNAHGNEELFSVAVPFSWEKVFARFQKFAEKEKL